MATTLMLPFTGLNQSDRNQSLRSFCLRLQELFSRLKQKDNTGLGEGHVLLRDQFVMGLREGPIRQELRRLLRKTPALSFDKVKIEALALEEEQEDDWPPSTCQAVGKQAFRPQSTVTDWKQEFRNEILQEVKEHMAQMAKTIVSEMRDSGKREVNSTQAPLQRTPFNNRNDPRTRPAAGPCKYKWDPTYPLCRVHSC